MNTILWWTWTSIVICQFSQSFTSILQTNKSWIRSACEGKKIWNNTLILTSSIQFGIFALPGWFRVSSKLLRWIANKNLRAVLCLVLT